MNKTIIGIIIGILSFGILIWIARPVAPEFRRGELSGQNRNALSVSSNGLLSVAEANNYNFGSISMAAGKVLHQFKIKNTGTEAVTIRKMYTSCMCTTASLLVGDPSIGLGQVKRFGPFGMPGHGAIPFLNQIINPNEEATVEVVFDPAAHGPAGLGRIQRTVILENDTGRPLELQFAAMVTP